MNIHHLLSRFSHDQLTQLSGEFGVVTMSPSTRNLLNDVLAKYRDDRFIARMLAELPEAHRGFLQTLVFFMPLKDQAVEAPEVLRQAWFGHEVNPLQLLFDKGLLFKKDEALTYTVALPDDLHKVFAALLMPKKISLPSNEVHSQQENTQRIRVLEWLFHWLCFLDRRKAALTQKGSIHLKVMEMFEKRYPAENYSMYEFYFGLSFCRHQHLVTEQSGSLRTSAVINNWFQQPVSEMRMALWRYFLLEEVYPNRVLQQYLLFLYAHCLTQDDNLISYLWDDCLKTFMRQINPSLPLNSELHQSIAEWMRLLEFIGVIQTDSLDNPTRFWMTPVGKQLFRAEAIDAEAAVQDHGMLQPNFDWLIPPTVGYEDLWKIDQIAEMEQRDVMTRYRLTQGSILHAMRKGWSQDEVVSFILEHKQNRVPDNVLYSIKEWCGKYGEIRLKRVLLVECQTKPLADELTKIETLQQWLSIRIGDCHFAVDENELRNLSKALQDLGYEPAVIKPSVTTDKT